MDAFIVRPTGFNCCNVFSITQYKLIEEEEEEELAVYLLWVVLTYYAYVFSCCYSDTCTFDDTYKPNPYHCDQFCQCAPLTGTTYRWYTKQCPSGTLWNQQLLTCDHEYNVNCHDMNPCTEQGTLVLCHRFASVRQKHKQRIIVNL